jgi:hypothetical protein
VDDHARSAVGLGEPWHVDEHAWRDPRVKVDVGVQRHVGLWQNQGMPKSAEPQVAKLRVKIGPHEFEAEGPRDVVAEHFDAWKQLVATPLAAGTARPLPSRADTGTSAAADMARLEIFAPDMRRNLVKLRASLAGKIQHADAAWPRSRQCLLKLTYISFLWLTESCCTHFRSRNGRQR